MRTNNDSRSNAVIIFALGATLLLASAPERAGVESVWLTVQAERRISDERT